VKYKWLKKLICSAAIYFIAKQDSEMGTNQKG
jgi:hypothetical protein